MNRTLCLLPALGLLACSPSVLRKDEDPMAAISRLERTRSLGSDGDLSTYAAAARPEVRARAFLALARIQALTTAPLVVQGLVDADPQVRGQAAFAAGELAQAWEEVPEATRQLLSRAVLAAERQEKDDGARLFELEALGKLATPEALAALVLTLGTGAPADVARAATSLGVAARAKHPLPEDAWALLPGALPKARWPVAYAVASSHDPRGRSLLVSLTRDPDPQVRAVVMKGLADLPPEAGDLVLLGAALSDPDGRVAAEAVRGLTKRLDGCTQDTLCPALAVLGSLSEAPKAFEAGDPARGSLPLLALAQSPLPDLVRPLLVSLRQATRTAAQSPSAGLPHHGKGGALRVTNVQALQRDLGRIDCRLAAAQDRIDGRLQAVRDCGFGQLSEAQRLFLGLSALPEGPHFKERVALADLTSALSHPNPSVRLAAVNALGETGKPEAAEAVRPFLSSDDLVLAADAAAAAGALHDTKALPMLAKVAERVRTELPEEAAPVAEAALALDAEALVPEFQKWLLAPHQNLRIQAAKVLSTFEHRRVEVPVVPQPDRSFAVPPAGTVLRLATEGGVIDVRLRPDLAPQTSGNFAALAKKGYFKDLTFHRIVPDFVVQGGDPRGDGEGGPGYTLPCEVGPLRYARGVVGVALSGKDTGGSQLFVTTSPQPHLDGRYTAFGEVVSGMEVVDALLEGERILEVSVVPPTK